MPRLAARDPAGMLPAMAKKPNAPRETPAVSATLPRWRISLLKGTPAKFLGYVEAPDEKAAIEQAAKEYKVADALRDRIVARREP
jgi:hypothetical protein